MFTVDDGWVWVFAALEHWSAECVGWHVTQQGNRFAALEPIRQGLTTRYGRTSQRVLLTLGRQEELEQSGQWGALLRSGAGLTESGCVLDAHAKGKTARVEARRIGPGLVFERLWRETRIRAVLERRLQGRKFAFSVERAVFVTVLHRLFASGSERSGQR